MTLKIFLLLLLASPVYASQTSLALSMVPKGKLVEQVGRDFVIKTEAGTKIQIEFKRSGRFEEAKGMNLNKGDELEPGEGLISLSSAARVLAKKGIPLQGTWHLDQDEKLGWVYEMENTLVDARSGKIIDGELNLTAKKAE